MKTSTPSGLPEPQQNQSMASPEDLAGMSFASPQDVAVAPQNMSTPRPQRGMPEAPKAPAAPSPTKESPQQDTQVAGAAPSGKSFTTTGEKVQVQKDGVVKTIDSGALEYFGKFGYSPVGEEEKTKEAPTVAESTAKVNPDGSTTTQTKDYGTPEAQEYKKQLDDASASIDTEIQYAKSKFESIMATADEAQAALMRSIEKSFEVRKYEMDRINVASLNTQELLGSRSGRQRYAPEMQSTILSSEERAGLVRLSEIEALEYQAIAAAQKAATEEDLAILNQRMSTLFDLRQEKNDIVADMYNMAVLEEQRAQQRAKFDIDMKKFQSEISNFQRQNESSYAQSVATGLVSVDENMQIVEPTALEIEQAANDIGIDPILLNEAVFNQIQELRQLNADEYGTYFQRQQFQAEQAQLEFQNYLNQQKFTLEEQMFGFKVTEAGFAVVDGQLVNVDTGATGSARDWANQIAKGKLKMSDVPADLKSAVVSELETMPPKQEDIREIQQKIKEIDDITKMPGMRKGVGVNWIARTNFNPLDWNDKAQKNAFIGKVERLLSEKTLNSLIDAKANGATFGALSEGELQILRASASAIGSWARDTDGDGVTDFYEVDEKTFTEEVNRIKGEYQKLADEAQKAAPFQPFTNFQDFYNRATENQKKLYEQFNNDPAFQNASVQDLLDAVNQAEGFTGEKGSGVVKSVIQQRFPSGSVGGQCGTFAHKIVDFPPVGDPKEQKFASVDKFGIKRENWTPRIGDVVITGEHPKWGHVAIVNDILPNGEIQLTESNYNNDERVTHNRTISYSSPQIYGAIRGSYKV